MIRLKAQCYLDLAANKFNINAIEEGFNKVSGRGGKKMDSDQIIKEIENGKVLMIKQPDGSLKVINTLELIEMTIDETGNVTSVKSLKSSDKKNY